MVVNRKKLLITIIVLLLLLNVITITSLSFSPSESGEHDGGPKNIIIEKLHLDASQQQEYRKCIDWHRNRVDSLVDIMQSVRGLLYSHLSDSGITEHERDSLTLQLAQLQQQIENTHYKHFEDIKKLCRKDQLESYAALTKQLPAMFSRGKPKRK